MDVGIIGLGRMGGGVARRLLRGGHRVVAYNRTFAKTEALAGEGAVAARSLTEMVAQLPAPRTVWLYLPAGAVAEEHIAELLPLLEAGDVLLDGGNSQFSHSLATAARCAGLGLTFMDVGTSGGTGGEARGYCLMIGGDAETFARLTPLWQSVALAGGFSLAGPSGAGHFVKMVHNGIEYGIMQAYAEGLELMESGSLAGRINVPEVARLWQQGSIIQSFIGEQVATALARPELLQGASPSVAHTGEGQWAVEEGARYGIPTPVLTASLYARMASQRHGAIGNRLLSAVRYLFGGHSLG